VKELLKIQPDLILRGWGGDRMSAEGVEIVKHYRDLAFMGFTEVLLNIRTILKNLDFCKREIIEFKPDAIVLIDYPGFNLRIAEYAHRLGIPVIYYISPQIWAWKQSRIKKIKKYIQKMVVILPFEKEFYNRFDYDVSYHGHPLLDEIDRFRQSNRTRSSNLPPEYIALLPGSRKQEIKTMLPIMLEGALSLNSLPVVIGKAPSVDVTFYKSILKEKNKDVLLYEEGTYSLLMHADAALVTSGTATLETALFNVPEIVCYKGGTLSYYIARRLIKVKYISLVNLILDREAVPELIQHELNAKSLKNELIKIVKASPERENMLKSFLELQNRLGGPGASKRVAVEMIGYMHQLKKSADIAQ
jgi:lipid-A-disaccharide synthase